MVQIKIVFFRYDAGIVTTISTRYYGGYRPDGSPAAVYDRKNVIIGSVSINGETFWIIPVEPRARTEISVAPLHIIYSSRNIRNVQFKID